MTLDLDLIGYASGLAGVDSRCGEGPVLLKKNVALANFNWHMIFPAGDFPASAKDVKEVAEKLALQVSGSLKNKRRICVLGGDHTSAIGTWSGVYDAYHQQGDIGLIWVDAHMDSHTPETSESGRIHGMPLAALMGHGSSLLTQLLHENPKLLPQNVCLIGVRSFEKGEADLLNNLNIKIYFMDEVKERGLQAIFPEAIAHVTKNTIGFGISLDLDSIDPHEAPGVDVPEPNGIHALDLLEVLLEVSHHQKLLGAEIVEFDPSRDKSHLTENLVIKLIRSIYGNLWQAEPT